MIPPDINDNIYFTINIFNLKKENNNMKETL